MSLSLFAGRTVAYEISVPNAYAQNKKGNKDQESIQSSTIPHGKVTKTQLNITNESQGQLTTRQQQTEAKA